MDEFNKEFYLSFGGRLRMTRQEVLRVASRNHLEVLARGCIYAANIGTMYCILTMIRILAQNLQLQLGATRSYWKFSSQYQIPHHCSPSLSPLSLPPPLIESHLSLADSEFTMHMRVTLNL